MGFASQMDEEQLSETNLTIDYLGSSSEGVSHTTLSIVYYNYYTYKLINTNLNTPS